MPPVHVQHLSDDSAPPRVYGPRTAKGEPRRCRRPGCNRPVPPKSRRHDCSRCRTATARGRAVDAPCAVCGCKDLRVLGLVELADGEVVACANCRAIRGRLRLTLDELRLEADGAAAAA